MRLVSLLILVYYPNKIQQSLLVASNLVSDLTLTQRHNVKLPIESTN